jgi:hypothetical protein
MLNGIPEFLDLFSYAADLDAENLKGVTVVIASGSRLLGLDAPLGIQSVNRVGPDVTGVASNPSLVSRWVGLGGTLAHFVGTHRSRNFLSSFWRRRVAARPSHSFRFRRPRANQPICPDASGTARLPACQRYDSSDSAGEHN